MRFDIKRMGARIAEARLKRGFVSQAELCRQINRVAAGRFETKTGKKRPKETVTSQSVHNWETGKVVPSMEMLALLAEVLEEEEEWILFGSRKGSEQQERLYLSRISEEEGRLLTAFREASREAQKAILETSKSIAKASPAPHAVVHHLKRKDDRA